MTDLDKLIAAVEAGTLCSGEFCVSAEDVATIEAVFPMTDDDDTPELIGMAMDGSLDAALRLHEALLPGWHYRITRGKHTPEAIVQRDLLAGEHASAETDTPARAWLLAILRALESMEDAAVAVALMVEQCAAEVRGSNLGLDINDIADDVRALAPVDGLAAENASLKAAKAVAG